MLDSITLVIALTATFSLQAILFLLMTFFIKAYKGMRLWAFGCLGLALNFISIYFRSQGFSEEASIVISNTMSVISLLCFNYGTNQIMNMPFKLKWGIWSAVIYLLVIAYYTFIDNQLNERILVYSTMTSTILLLNSRLLAMHHHNSYKVSAWILSSLFFILGMFFLFRAVFTILNPVTNNNFFDNFGFQPITLLISLCMGILWTQGIILLVNQKLNAELLDKTKELEHTNADKDKFFSILAHDLRGPLTTIMGMVDLMADKKSELGETLMQEMAQAMKKSVHSTNILMDNLLDWASLQRGLKVFHPEPTTFGELMATVIHPLLLEAEGKKISLVDEIPAATPLTADTKMAQSIFRNLLTNAIKFTPVNGTVRLHTSMTERGQLTFSVSDNGIGMDEKMIENLFLMGPQSRRLGTGGETSTGLGLMICKEFIEKHGGSIWVDSVVNKGSTFTFCLEPIE